MDPPQGAEARGPGSSTNWEAQRWAHALLGPAAPNEARCAQTAKSGMSRRHPGARRPESLRARPIQAAAEGAFQALPSACRAGPIPRPGEVPPHPSNQGRAGRRRGLGRVGRQVAAQGRLPHVYSVPVDWGHHTGRGL
ncbi:hypothetical protein P7K49_009445 [Saguinus oedipus]|uniref:Uncharacterized protein n=1 Tax=Saguinus oedipus TaxID=9490 RepID=A0ABQ9VK10_SAGOE|nr:hypothetical protein P7K49_009445 [Saguinus oedipus]